MKVLLISGDGDGAARYFLDNYESEAIYQEMLEKGLTKMVLADDYDDDGIKVKLHEFGKVDKEFVNFLYDVGLIDCDLAESLDFVIVGEEK